jgi:hypothetical protein
LSDYAGREWLKGRLRTLTAENAEIAEKKSKEDLCALYNK